MGNSVTRNAVLAALFSDSLGKAVHTSLRRCVSNSTKEAAANLACNGRNVDNASATTINEVLPESVSYVVGTGEVGVDSVCSTLCRQPR